MLDSRGDTWRNGVRRRAGQDPGGGAFAARERSTCPIRPAASAWDTTTVLLVAAAAAVPGAVTSRKCWCGLAFAAASTWELAEPVATITPQLRWTSVFSIGNTTASTITAPSASSHCGTRLPRLDDMR